MQFVGLTNKRRKKSIPAKKKMIDAGGLCSPIQFLLLNHNNTIMSQVPWNFVGRRLVPLCSKRSNYSVKQENRGRKFDQTQTPYPDA